MSDNEFFGGRRRRRGNGGDAFSPYSLFASGEQGVWYDPSDLTPEKVSWRRNLLTYSQDFENAAWTKTNSSILSNLALYSQDFDNAAWANQVGGVGTTPVRTANFAVAPDGTTTADRLQFSLGGGTTTADLAYIAQSIIPLSTVCTGSFYVKLNSGTADIYVRTGNGSTTYTVTSSWTRVEVACTAANTSAQFGIGLRGGQTPANTNTADILIWGAQLVTGSTAQTYTRSLATAAPIQFSDPLGGTLADKLVENTANAQHRVLAVITVVAGVTHTMSFYVKPDERTRVSIFDNASAADTEMIFDLSNGTVVRTGAAVVASSITSLSGGWYRITASSTPTVTSMQSALRLVQSGTTSTYTGDGTSGLYVYGAQVEQASTASAYQRITDFNSDFLAAFPTHALYQESTATTAVTTLGQSVGFVLDKRLSGLSALGPNLVTNGDFSNGTTGWTLAANATVTVEPSFGGKTGIVRMVNTSTTGVTTSQTVTGLTAGRSYLVTFDAYAPSPNTQVNAAAGYVTETASLRIAPTGEDTWQTRQFIFTASGTSTTLSFNAGTGGAGTVSSGDQALIGNFTMRAVLGNHALQATSASRPTLQARSNLLTHSEQFDNAAWTKSNATITANTTTAPDGTTTADKLVENTANANHTTTWATTLTSGTTYTLSVYAKAAERTQVVVQTSNIGNWAASVLTIFNLSNGTISLGTGTITPLANGWYRCSITATFGAANATGGINVLPASAGAVTYLGDGVSGIYVWGAQLELASTATTYQRIVTATDYADIGLPRNLTFDGVDDSLATAGNVDFSGTDNVSLFSGLFKSSDAAQGIVTELTASAATTNGAFNLQAPSATPGTNRYAAESRGSALATANVTSATYAAPRTDVVTVLGTISTDTLDTRIGGASVATSATDQGTGNYANAVLYVGRRGGTTLPFNGRLFQLVIRGAATDSVTVGNAERWVGQLTGVAL